MMSLVRAQLGEPKTRYKLIGVDDAEGPPVPIPNTEVKLSGAEDSAPGTGCENREMPTQASKACKYSSIAQSVVATYIYVPDTGLDLEDKLI